MWMTAFVLSKGMLSTPFMRTLNSIDPHISFTIEEESDQQIAFLDTLVFRKDNTISIVVHRKATHTNRFLEDFSSHHDKRQKINATETLYTTRLNSLVHRKEKILKLTTPLMLYESTTIPPMFFSTS